MNLIEVNDLKRVLSITHNTEDVLLHDLIDGVSVQLENYCNRKFEKVERTEYPLTAPGNALFRVKAFPIISVTSIHDDPDHAFGSDTLVDTSDYVFYEELGLIERVSGNFNTGKKSVKIVYTAGYEAPKNIPADLKQACILQAGFIYQRRMELGLKSVSLEGGGSVTHQKLGLLPAVKQLLAPYRVLPI